jgi:hypothetical protein
MKIAYLCCKYDDIARMVHLDISDFDNIYSPPTVRFDERYVIKELEKVDYTIFLISKEDIIIDKKALKRLKFLKERVKKLFAIIPSDKRIRALENSKNVKFIRYKTKDELIDYILSMIKKKSLFYYYNLVLLFILLKLIERRFYEIKRW